MISLIENRWDESLNHLSYGDGYDIRVHGVQVALSVLARRSRLLGHKLKDINFTASRFGSYDVKTEDAIKLYQIATGIPDDGILNRLTFEGIFLSLRNELGVTVVEVETNKLRICEITKELIDEFPNLEDTDMGDGIDDDGLLDDDSIGNNDGSDSILDDGLGGISVGEYPNYNSKGDYWFPDSFWHNMTGYGKGEDMFALFTPKFPNFGGEDYTPGRGYSKTGDHSNDFINDLLANSIYEGNFDYSKPLSWVSNSQMNINVDGFRYETSSKYDTFFSKKNTGETRGSDFEITIVYGANGQFAKKLINLIPRARSQQLDASGEALYDVIEFVAKDIIETDNSRR